MIPIESLTPGMKFDNLLLGTAKVDHIDIYLDPGHPGVDKPHAHIVLWHVPVSDEARVAH
jgi:hypothetical protein